jgi:hypothetical protein
MKGLELRSMLYTSAVLSTFQWSLDISLQDDWRQQLYNRLVNAGYKDADVNKADLQFFNLIKRQVDPRPRKVLYSREFKCPDKYERALKEFQEKAEHGNNLRPYMSSKLRLANYDDLLLNDWNIQHFHLTRRFNEDGSAKSSDYEIFTYVTEDIIYMIQVYHHQEDDLYSKKEMVRIIRDNWPELIEKYHIRGITGLSEKVDDHTYEILRKAHVTTFVELGENEVYGLIGGGYASNGYSTEALRNADYWSGRLKIFQDIVKNNVVWLGKTINAITGNKKSECIMKIKLLPIDSTDKVTMCEVNSSLIVQVDTRKEQMWVCRPQEIL